MNNVNDPNILKLSASKNRKLLASLLRHLLATKKKIHRSSFDQLFWSGKIYRSCLDYIPELFNDWFSDKVSIEEHGQAFNLQRESFATLGNRLDLQCQVSWLTEVLDVTSLMNLTILIYQYLLTWHVLSVFTFSFPQIHDTPYPWPYVKSNQFYRPHIFHL